MARACLWPGTHGYPANRDPDLLRPVGERSLSISLRNRVGILSIFTPNAGVVFGQSIPGFAQRAGYSLEATASGPAAARGLGGDPDRLCVGPLAPRPPSKTRVAIAAQASGSALSHASADIA